jgi:hypothetical protein
VKEIVTNKDIFKGTCLILGNSLMREVLKKPNILLAIKSTYVLFCTFAVDILHI